MKILRYEIETTALTQKESGMGELATTYKESGGLVVQLPKGAKILTIEFLLGKLWLWALADPKATLEARPIWMLSADVEAPVGVENMRHICSVAQDCGRLFVSHFFEEE